MAAGSSTDREAGTNSPPAAGIASAVGVHGQIFSMTPEPRAVMTTRLAVDRRIYATTLKHPATRDISERCASAPAHGEARVRVVSR